MYRFNPLLESEINNKNDKSNQIISGTSGAIVGGFAPTVASIPLLTKLKVNGFNNKSLSPENKIPEAISALKVNGNQSVNDYMKEKGLKISTKANSVGPYFNATNNTISLPIKDKHMDKYGKSLFAHELGHSKKLQLGTKNSVPNLLTYNLSNKLTNAAALAQIVNCFRSDEESRKKVGKALSVAGGAAAIPMIAEEIGASIRGSKMLNLKGADKARSFVGVGSYIALALSPTIIYHVSERTRKFLKSLQKIKNENPETSRNLDALKQQDIKVKI